MAVAGTAVLSLMAETARFKAQLDDASRKLDSTTAKMNRSLKSVEKGFQGLQKTAAMVNGALTGLFAAFAGGQLLALGTGALRAADEFNMLQARIKSVVGETGNFNHISRELIETSKQTGVEFSNTVQIFQRIKMAGQEFKMTNDEILRGVKAVEQLGVVSGASNDALRFGLTQFGQAMSSNIVRAEEFNSIMENIPMLGERIAEGFGVTSGQLRKAVIEGRVLSKDVMEILVEKADQINEDFEKMPRSLGMSINSLNTSWGEFLSTLNQTFPILDGIKAAIDSITAGLDQFTRARNSITNRNKLQGNQAALNSFLKYDELIRNNPNSKHIPYWTEMRDKFEEVFIRRSNEMFGTSGGSTANREQTPIHKFGPGKKEGSKGGSRFGSGVQTLWEIEQEALEGGFEAFKEIVKQEIEDAKELNAIWLEAWNEGQEAGIDILKRREEIAKSIPGVGDMEGFKQYVQDLKVLVDEGTINQQTALDLAEKAKETYNLIPQAVKDAREEEEKRSDVLKDLIGDQEGYNKHLERLKYWLDQGRISQEQFNKAQEEAKVTFGLVKEQAKSSTDELLNYLQSVGTKFEDTFMEMAKSGKFAFKDLVASALEDLARLVLRLTVIQPIIQGFKDLLDGSDGSSGGGGFWKSLFTSATGVAVGAVAESAGGSVDMVPKAEQIPLRAAGGPVTGGRPYIVGERGPELFMPGRSGAIIPNDQLMGGGGGQTVINQYINVQAIDTKDFQQRLSEQAPMIARMSVKANQEAHTRRGSSFGPLEGRRR